MTVTNRAVMPIYKKTTCGNEIDWDAPDSFRYAVEVHKPHGVLDQVLDWCRHEITDPGWRWQMVTSSGRDEQGRYIFFFNNEQDYFMFVLKWR